MSDVDWGYLVWWMKDESVWEWLRIALAGLVGAVVGGAFTLWGQARAAKAQADRESRAQSVADLRALFEGFVKLGQDIDDAPHTMGHILGRPWRKVWRTVWTRERERSLRSQAELIPDEALRRHVVQIVKYLRRAPDLSAEGPLNVKAPLKMLVEKLSEAGTIAMAATVRGERYEYGRTEAMMKRLKGLSDEYDKWEEHSIASSEAADEARAAEITPEERAVIDKLVTDIIRAEDEADRKPNDEGTGGEESSD